MGSLKLLKSNWPGKKSGVFSFYCPQCRIPRRISHSPSPRPIHFMQVGLTALFITALSWNWLSWKGIISFLPLWMIFEMTYRIRTRAALKCDACGLDPILYLSDTPRARQEVEDHWRKKFSEKGIPYPGPP